MTMDRFTGEPLDELGHIRQSIADILTTPLGSRVMRRDYGSLLPDLIDAPLNDATHLQACAAVTAALIRWEPRVRLDRVQLSMGEQPSQAVLDVEGSRIDTNEPLSLRVPLNRRASA